jgi:hypothetical protein
VANEWDTKIRFSLFRTSMGSRANTADMGDLFPDKFTQHIPMVNSSTQWRLESEDLHIRNHDQATKYEITLEIKQDGETQHHAEYHLLPDQSGSSVNLLPAGEYTVVASLDGRVSKTAIVDVSDEPAETIVIEIINGNLKITEGLA